MFLFDKSSNAKQKFSHGVNVVCDGSPTLMCMVRRISFGITTRPRSSIRRTIPVALMCFSLSVSDINKYLQREKKYTE